MRVVTRRARSVDGGRSRGSPSRRTDRPWMIANTWPQKSRPVSATGSLSTSARSAAAHAEFGRAPLVAQDVTANAAAKAANRKTFGVGFT